MGRKSYLSLVSLGTLALLGILALFITPALADDDGDDDGLEVIASGLDQPRGLNFGPDGALYVTESGSGGVGDPDGETFCFFGPIFWFQCFGNTGAVTRIDDSEQERILTGLASSGAQTDATLHPAGWFADGPSDTHFSTTAKRILPLAADPQETRSYKAKGHRAGLVSTN
jgi:hypothetical protein